MLGRRLGLLAFTLFACGGGAGSATPPAGNEVRLRSPTGGIYAGLAWVAAQDGDGAWTRLPADGDVYRFRPTSDRFSLAFACPAGRLGEVIQATPAELPEVTVPCVAAGNPGAVRRTGALVGVPAGARPSVTFGLAGVGPIGADVAPDGKSYSVELPPGTYDYAAVDGGTPPRVLVGRGLAVEAAGTTDLDFATGARTTSARDVAVNGATPGETVAVKVFLTTSGRALAAFEAPRVHALGALAAGETQTLRASGADARGVARWIDVDLGAGVSAIDLPPALVTPQHTGTATGPIIRPQVKLTPYPGVSFYQLNSVTAGTDLRALGWVVNTSAGWLGAGDTIALPDLTGVAGFDPIWGPARRNRTLVNTFAVTSTVGMARALDGLPFEPQAGWKTTTASGTLTVLEAMP